MRRVYNTTKSKEELEENMNYFKFNYHNHYKESEVYGVFVKDTNTIKVGSTRISRKFKLDFNVNGYITVKSCKDFGTILTTLILLIIDLIIIGLIAYNGLNIYGIMIITGIILIEYYLIYLCYESYNFKRLERFMYKYLGIIH